MKSSFDRTLSDYKKVAIDSMCFIYQFEGSKIYGELTKQLFLRLQKNKLTAVSSVLTIAEILAFDKLQKNRVLFEQAKAKLYSTPNLRIITVNEAISEASAILKCKYKITLPDAIQLSTAIMSDQKAFISNDYHLKKIKEVRVLILDDFKPSNRSKDKV